MASSLVCGKCRADKPRYGFCRKCGARQTGDGIWESPEEYRSADAAPSDDPQLRLLRQIAADVATVKLILAIAAVLWVVGAVAVLISISSSST